MNDQRNGSFFQSYTGRLVWPVDPRPEDICIEDIAHALSLQCRYTGHLDRFYSIAEHSVLISHAVEPRFAYSGLMHDAAEAYLGDISRPLKGYLPDYKLIEKRMESVIGVALNVTWDLETMRAVKDADNRILLTERNALMKPPAAPWHVYGPPLDVPIVGYPAPVAEELFLRRYRELTGA